MATLADVKRILPERGYFHIVARERSGWVHTLCKIFTPGESVPAWPPKAKVCRKCREALAVAKVPEQTQQPSA